MHEKIKELAEQAGVQEDLVDNLKGDVLTYIARPQDIQKFAELIVREYELRIQLLITQAEKENTRLLAGNGEYSGKLAVPVDQLTKIKEDLGVKE